MKTRRRPLFLLAALVVLISLPSRAQACACCSNPGDYHIGFGKPSAYEFSLYAAGALWRDGPPVSD